MYHVCSSTMEAYCVLFFFQVDNALQCMMNENSMDYVAKFAELAASMSDNGGPSQQ